MRNRAIVGLVLLALAGVIGWQVAACYLAKSELQSDMRDLAVQNPFRIGLAPAPTEQGLLNSVIARAKEHGIQLQPQEVTVQCTFTPDILSVSLAAHYETRVNLLVYSFTLHFTPSASHSAKVIVK